MRRGVVKKLQHERMTFQGLLNDAALHPFPTAVDEPHLMDAGGMGLVQILFDDRWDVARREGVKIEVFFNRNPKRVLILHAQGVVGFSYRTVTSVLIPPRTEKSPTTAIRRGRQAATRSSRI